MSNVSSFGLVAKDKISGFTGVITGKASYITGCDQYLLTPRMSGDTILDGRWYDEGRIEILPNEIGVKTDEVTADKNGCDIPAPVK